MKLPPPISRKSSHRSDSNRSINLAMGLVCVAHFFSHFNMMLLPPLLPVLTDALQIGYTEIGLALTLYSLVSGITQTPMGFLVDRFGAAKILVLGVGLEGLAFGLIGVFPIFSALLLFLAIAGMANAVYHPADYTILNQIVPESRIGKAFSYHTASGLIGEAAAPATILLLSALLGWKYALMVCGALGVIVSITLASNMHLFKAATSDTKKTNSSQKSLKLFLSAPLILGLLFFVGISLTSRGATGFSVSALHVGRGMELGMAGMLLSAWLFAAPIGVLVGGRLADARSDHTNIITCCFLVVSMTLALLAYFQPGFGLSALLFAIGGFCAGAVAPSRDMLIRAITPEGSTGKVFGFVSTGFNVGGMLAPPLYGYLLDQGFANGVFWTAALASLLTITTVISARRVSERSRRAASGLSNP